MGGLIILSSIVIPTLLFAKLNNVYIIFNAGLQPVLAQVNWFCDD